MADSAGIRIHPSVDGGVRSATQGFSGGELTCTVTVSANPSASCTGSESDWIAAGAKVYYFLAASPFTVPGIIERIK